jgi:hypothetical protein
MEDNAAFIMKLLRGHCVSVHLHNTIMDDAPADQTDCYVTVRFAALRLVDAIGYPKMLTFHGDIIDEAATGAYQRLREIGGWLDKKKEQDNG